MAQLIQKIVCQVLLMWNIKNHDHGTIAIWKCLLELIKLPALGKSLDKLTRACEQSSPT